ncbi:MAG: type II toxin-antitoxin system HicA family toxin [Gemmataceae bacterium]|nr:type II toxin-antitoxin system HicA family toxin [Gemmataceae bacterium]MCI0642678.1 type II toxin-antitoxin system HicA family toxin [Gemmataceae bacterium]MCI0739479.1 type II toxin-antitoxin system HicA family toxin [Gemmataceae bacterium]
MNRRKFEKHLRSNGCVLHHHGGKHDVWVNGQSLAQAPVPRHTRLKRGTVRGICRVLGIPFPKGS